MGKGESVCQIKRKLHQEGLSLEASRVASIFTEENQSEDLQVRKLVESQFRKVKKMPEDKKELYKLKQKIMAALMRKGHSFGGVKIELEEYLKKILAGVGKSPGLGKKLNRWAEKLEETATGFKKLVKAQKA